MKEPIENFKRLAMLLVENLAKSKENEDNRAPSRENKGSLATSKENEDSVFPGIDVRLVENLATQPFIHDVNFFSFTFLFISLFL